MSEERKVGFWKWLLIKSPVAILKETTSNPSGSYGVMVLTAIIGIVGIIIVPMIGFVHLGLYLDIFLVLKATVICFILVVISLYGYYKKFVCKEGDE